MTQNTFSPKSLPFFEEMSLKINFWFKIETLKCYFSERFNAVKKFHTLLENKCVNVT